MKKLTKLDYFNIIIFSLVGQIAWCMENMFYNLYIVDEFSSNPSSIALMVAASAIVATLSTLFIGALSDKIGKRKIFIVLGYIIWSLVILSFCFVNKNTISNPSLGIGLIIILDCVMTFFGSSANDACYNAYLTDISNDSNRGKIEGINSSMPLIAILIVFGLLSPYAKIQEDGKDTWNIVFIIISAIVLLCGILGIFTIKDVKKEKSNESYFKNIFYGFKLSVIKENKALYIVLLSFMIFGISLQVYMPYYILYLQKSNLEVSFLSGIDGYIVIMAPAIIIASIITIFYGKLIDKFGFVKTLIPSLIVYAIGLILLSFFTNPALMFCGCLFMMSGYLTSTACFNSKIRNLTPPNKEGLFQGLRIFASVLIPMLIGPFIGSAICGGGAMFGVIESEKFVVSKFIFLGGFIISLFVIIPLLFMEKKHAKN